MIFMVLSFFMHFVVSFTTREIVYVPGIVKVTIGFKVVDVVLPGPKYQV